MQNGRADDLMKIWKKVQNHPYGKIRDCFNSADVVKRHNGALFCEKETALSMLAYDFTTTGKCNMYIAPEPVKTTVLAFMYNRNSPWIKPINKRYAFSEYISC